MPKSGADAAADSGGRAAARAAGPMAVPQSRSTSQKTTEIQKSLVLRFDLGGQGGVVLGHGPPNGSFVLGGQLHMPMRAMSGARDSDKRDTRSAPRAAVHRRDADD